MAQDATTTPETAAEPTNPALQPLKDEVERLKLEKERAGLLKDIATAEKDRLAAELPQSTTTGATGSVTVGEGAGYFAEILAYQTLGRSADAIQDAIGKEIEKWSAEAIKGAGGKETDGDTNTVVVTDQLDLSQTTALWEVIDLKIESFEEEFGRVLRTYNDAGDRLEQEGVVAATAATLTSFLGAAADIAAFFKVDQEIKNRPVTLDDKALLAEVAQRIVGETITVVIPDLAVTGTRALIGELQKAQDLRSQIKDRLNKIRTELAKKTAVRDTQGQAHEDATIQLARLKTDKAPAAQIRAAEDAVKAAKRALDRAQAPVRRLTGVVTEFETLITAFDTLQTALTTAPTGGGKTPLETVAVVDIVRGTQDALVLYVDVVSSGGEVHITKSVWSSGRISYVGGSVAVYFLVDGAGELKASGSVPLHDASSFKGRKGPTTLAAGTVIGG